MPAYSFKERFVPLIMNGEKNQTIRSKRRYRTKKGDTLYLYFGMRTKWCKKLKEVTCTGVARIEIKRTGSVYINGRKLDPNEKNFLAFNDGFRNSNPDSLSDLFAVMFRWWKQTHPLPFKGDIIYW